LSLQQAVFGEQLPPLATDRLCGNSSELVPDVWLCKLTESDTQALEVFGNGSQLGFAFDSKDDQTWVF